MSCHQNEMVTCVDQNLDMDQATYRRQGTTDGLLMLNKLSQFYGLQFDRRPNG